MNLTLKQMQDMGVHNFMNDKEIQTQLGKALEEQALCAAKEFVKSITLESVLEKGGVFKHKHNGKSYTISVIIPSDYELYEKQQMNLDDGVVYELPPIFKFHIKNALDNRVTVRAKTYTEAQSIIDGIYGKGVYKVSASSL